jgi:GTP pyrophosphokinase
MEYFVDESEPYIGDEEIHTELAEKFPAVKRRLDYPE